jgi:uncharacterized cupredoxin-like copper-binding protein
MTRRSFTRSLLGIAWLAAVLLIPSFALAQDGQEVDITLSEFKITPSSITVSAGQMVHFTVHNGGTEEHNFVVELEDRGIEKQLFDTNLMPGETRTADYVFPVADDWEMYCPVEDHKGHGMMGEIEVTSATPGGMPGTGNSSLSELWLLGMVALVLISLGALVVSKSIRGRIAR